MEANNVFSSCAKSLSQLMDVGSDDKELWTPEELGAILEHQLSASVAFDLHEAGRGGADQVRALAAGAAPPIKTFGDLFGHPRPPVELLELTKQFAKRCRSRSASPLPDEVATVLYLLSIVVALLRCGTRISNLDNQSLRYGLEWALAQPWLDEASRRLFCEGGSTINDRKAAPQ